MQPTISKTIHPNLIHVCLRRRAYEKHLLSMPSGQLPPAMFNWLSSFARDLGGTVVSQMVLGGTERPEANAAEVDQVSWPLSWLRGDACDGRSPAASQAIVICGTPVRSVQINGRSVGKVYEDADAVYCQLGGVLPTDATASRVDQARQFFENMEAGLAQAGMDFRHTVRTWLYLDQLLHWYDEFNEVRTRFFKERGVFDHLVPASTGIGAANRNGTALLGDALAILPKTDRIQVLPVTSPLQCPAIDYKSSFSRAVEIATPQCRELYVSGTASIAADGTSAHQGDPVRQVELTFQVIKAILDSRGMTWADATRAIAYFKDIKDVDVFGAYCDRAGLKDLPVICMHADVCRDELLFEIELEAVRKTTS